MEHLDAALGPELAALLGPARPPAPATWAGSGAMALTGRPGGPPLALDDAVAERLAALAAALPFDLDGPALLGERAAIAGLERRGDVSCGGRARLVRCADGGWMAVSLARVEDVEAVAAWLGLDPDAGEPPWEQLADRARLVPAAVLVEELVALDVPAARLGEVVHTPPAVVARRTARPAPAQPPAGSPPVVVDLSALWAGPLCSHLLGLAGARVVTVESTRRPDGARAGPKRFHDLLRAGTESVALDLGGERGRRDLARLVGAADVVVEGSRPRALRRLGIDADALMASGDGPAVWVSVTAHGRSGEAATRAGFGDDAAVAGGLVAADEHGPCFAGDAIADPATGLLAAAAALGALAAGGRWMLDVALARTAAWLAAPCGPAAGPAIGASGPVQVAPPRARPVRGRAPRLGEHTEAVLAELAATGRLARRRPVAQG